MKIPGATRRVAERLRHARLHPENRPLDAELAWLRAGKNLRSTLGVHRDLYSPDEVELMARARKIALRMGQVQLSRFLTLRRRGQRQLSPGRPVTSHECPRCGHVHCEPSRRLTRGEVERMDRDLRGALAECQRRRRAARKK